MNSQVETARVVTAAASTFLAALIMPEDLPLFFSVGVGLVVGTLASWVWSDQKGVKISLRWLLWQLGIWGLIFVLVLAAEEAMNLSVRASMASAAVLAFLGTDGLSKMRREFLKRIGMENDKS